MSRSEAEVVGEGEDGFVGLLEPRGPGWVMGALGFEDDVFAARVPSSAAIVSVSPVTDPCDVSSRCAFASASSRMGSVVSDALVADTENVRAGSFAIRRGAIVLNLVERTCDRSGRGRRREKVEFVTKLSIDEMTAQNRVTLAATMAVWNEKCQRNRPRISHSSINGGSKVAGWTCGECTHRMLSALGCRHIRARVGSQNISGAG